MQSFLLTPFTKLVKIDFRGSNLKAKQSHMSNFPFSFCMNQYQNTILHLVKTVCIKIFKKSIKNSHKSMQ